MENNWIIFDGNIISADEPVVPVVSRGLMYGDGIFETFRMYSGQTLFLQKHIHRLNRGLERLGISSRFAPGRLQKLIVKLLKKKSLWSADAIVRLQVWRDGRRGYQPDEGSEIHFSLTASACPEQFEMPHLVTVDTRRIPSASLPSDVKFSNGINYILAAREAARKGGDDALMKTTGGYLSETTIANIFWVRDGKIFTPSADCDLIPGITRDMVLQIIDREGLPLKTGKFPQEDILNADAAWICNSVREVLPVPKIDDYPLDVDNKLLIEIKERFAEFRDQNLKPLVAND